MIFLTYIKTEAENEYYKTYAQQALGLGFKYMRLENQERSTRFSEMARTSNRSTLAESYAGTFVIWE